MPDLALGDQILDCAGDIFDRHIGIDAMLIEQIDDVGPEAFQRSLGDRADVLGAAVHPGLPAGRRLDAETELGGDHHPLAHRGQRFAHHLFVGEGTIDLRRVEEGDAAVDCRADQRDAVGFAEGMAIGKVQAHAAEANGRNLETVLAEYALFHRLD